MRISRRLLPAGVLVLVACAWVPAAEAPDPAAEIQQLIADLDSNQFEVREKASTRLLALEEKALPALREALRGKPSLEKLRRLEAIVTRTEQVLLDRKIAVLLARVNEGGIDQFIDLMVERKGFAKAESWEAIFRLAQAMVQRAEQVGGKQLPAVGADYLKLPVAAGGPESNYNSKQRFLAAKIGSINAIHDCFVVCNGPIESINSTRNSILFVNGDIGGLNGTDGCVIFCNGTIKRPNGTSHCVIFCTGAVESPNSFSECVLFAQGKFTDGNSTRSNIMHVQSVDTNGSNDNQYIGLKEIKANLSQNDTFVKAERPPLHPLQLFDLGRLGLDLAMQDNILTATKVAEGKVFAKAGLRAGDQITAIDGKAVVTVEAARKLLLRKLPNDEATLTIRRGGEKLEIAVPF